MAALTIEGTVTYSDFDDVRTVQGWTSGTGEYRVVVSSERFGLTTDVYFDGAGVQTVTVTEFGDEETFRVAESGHFIVTGDERLSDLIVERDRRFGIATDWAIVSDGRETVRVLLDVRETDEEQAEAAFSAVRDDSIPIREEPTLAELPISLPATGSEGGHALIGPRPGIATYASASVSVVKWQSVIGNTSCLIAYNYRNNSTDYSRAYSLSVNNSPQLCYRMDVSLYGAPKWNGACTLPFIASGPNNYNYSSKSATFAPLAQYNRTCSNHIAWTSTWINLLPPSGLNAAITG